MGAAAPMAGDAWCCSADLASLLSRAEVFSKWFLMDSYLLTLTRTAPLTLLHPLPATHSSSGAPKGLPDTSWPWGLSPCSHPLLLLLPEERLKARGPCSVNTWTQREMVLYFHGGRLLSPFLSQPSRSGWKWTDPRGHGGSEARSFSFQLEESWAGVTPFAPTFTAGSQPVHLPEQQLWLPGVGGASHEASLSHRAFLVLEEAELQTQGLCLPFPAAFLRTVVYLQAGTGGRDKATRSLCPVWLHSAVHSCFKAQEELIAPYRSLQLKLCTGGAQRVQGKLRSPKPPASPPGCQLGGIAFRTVAGQEKPGSTGLFLG